MKVLICGTRMPKNKNYAKLVRQVLDEFYEYRKSVSPKRGFELTIIEGCCPNSADQYAEEWAKDHGIKLDHHPANKGNYLKRNIEMVEKADYIIGFWNNYSYGTAQCLATAMAHGKKARVILIK